MRLLSHAFSSRSGALFFCVVATFAPASFAAGPKAVPVSPAPARTNPVPSATPPAPAVTTPPVAPTPPQATPAVSAPQPNEPVVEAGPDAAELSPAAQCFPECRPGFVCDRGECISGCNPACPSGTYCAPDLMCEPVASHRTRARVTHVDPSEFDEEPVRVRQRRRRAAPVEPEVPVQHSEASTYDWAAPIDLKRVRFSIGPHLALIDQGYSSWSFGAALTPGLRVHFTEQLGLLAQANLGIGVWSDKSLRREDKLQSFSQLRGQITPFVSPNYGLYFGPTLALGRTWRSLVLEDEFGFPSSRDVLGLWYSGVGIRVGSFLGRSKRVEAHLEWLQFGQAEKHLDFSLNHTEIGAGLTFCF